MSENDGRRRAGPGWLILVAALAVPGFLFYNWSRSMKAEHERALTGKAMSRASEGALFATPPSGGRLVNPIARGAAAPAAASAVRPSISAASGLAASAPARPVHAPAAARAPAAAPGGSNAAAAAVVVSSQSVVLSRDPFVSPLDLVRQREAAAERERQRLAALAASRPVPHHHVRPIERKIEQDVELQGVITTPDGSARAIVNNETLSKGDTFVAPGHGGRVTVLEITSDTVWFVYKKRRFKLVISSE